MKAKSRKVLDKILLDEDRVSLLGFQKVFGHSRKQVGYFCPIVPSEGWMRVGYSLDASTLIDDESSMRVYVMSAIHQFLGILLRVEPEVLLEGKLLQKRPNRNWRLQPRAVKNAALFYILQYDMG